MKLRAVIGFICDEAGNDAFQQIIVQNPANEHDTAAKDEGKTVPLPEALRPKRPANVALRCYHNVISAHYVGLFWGSSARQN